MVEGTCDIADMMYCIAESICCNSEDDNVYGIDMDEGLGLARWVRDKTCTVRFQTFSDSRREEGEDYNNIGLMSTSL